MPVSDVVTAVAEWKIRKPGYDLWRAYYRGNHQLKFATKDFQEKYGKIVLDLRENLCPAVVSAFTDKLSIASWGDSVDRDEATEQGLSRLLNMVHREAFRCGDAYTLTWPNRRNELIARYHRADQMVPHVDEDDPSVLDWNAKVWYDATRKVGRVNLYYRDRCERYATINALPAPEKGSIGVPDFPENIEAWGTFDGDGDPDLIGYTSLPGMEVTDRVPVCWWKHDADDQQGHGYSVLTDVVPLQDGLNKSVADLLVTSESYAKPFWYLLNYVPEAKNPYTQAQQAATAVSMAQASGRFDPTRQRIFTHDGPGPFGQLNPPDLTRLLTIQDGFWQKVARVIGIPSYYFSPTSGDVPSGEALRVLTSRLSSAVRDFQQSSSPVLNGQLELLGIDATPKWADPMPMDEMEKLQAAVVEKEVGYPQETIFTHLGEDEPEELAAKAQAQQANAAAQTGQALASGNLFGL